MDPSSFWILSVWRIYRRKNEEFYAQLLKLPRFPGFEFCFLGALPSPPGRRSGGNAPRKQKVILNPQTQKTWRITNFFSFGEVLDLIEKSRDLWWSYMPIEQVY
jgi:hypothetical protein